MIRYILILILIVMTGCVYTRVQRMSNTIYEPTDHVEWRWKDVDYPYEPLAVLTATPGPKDTYYDVLWEMGETARRLGATAMIKITSQTVDGGYIGMAIPVGYGMSVMSIRPNIYQVTTAVAVRRVK